MVYVSHETPEQTEQRLTKVLAAAVFKRYEGAYAFREYPLNAFPSSESAKALAFVKDEDVWSVLQPVSADDPLSLIIYSFHFPDQLDNSGFVGWLASHVKRELGAGVIVVCGQNSRRGGIFDYWGVPVQVGESFGALVTRLQSPSLP